MQPKYSFIIATFNRLGEMQELCKSLIELDFDSALFELVVIDDGSKDGTKAFFQERSFDFPVQYTWQQNKGPGAARNNGMSIAKGEYFIFVDSDCILPPQYLTEVSAFLKENPVDAFGGPDTYHDSFPPMIKAINYSMTSFLGTGGTRGSKKNVTKYYPRSFNMGIRKEVFEKIGGMNELRHGQDMDYSSRIYENGFSVGFIENAFVYHKRRTSLRKFFKQIFNWGVARINLGRNHRELLTMVHFLPAILLFIALVVLVGAMFSSFISKLLLIGFLGFICLILFAFFQSFSIYKELKPALLSMITLPLQVLAYGLGTWSGILQWIRGKETAEGFVKNYYK